MVKVNNRNKIFITIFIMIVVASFFLRHKEEPVKKEKEKRTKQIEEKQTKAIESNFGNPSDYGIIIFKEHQKPTGQDEWNQFFKNKIKELKSQFSEEQWNEVQKKIAEDPKKTEEKIEKINKKIKEYKKIIKKKPFDQKTKEKIEQLMILKAIANKLPDKETK